MALRVHGLVTTTGTDQSLKFERLFTGEYRRVVAIAHRIVNDADEAEDVAQEVFLSFMGRHDPDAPYAPAWLHRAAAHLALNAVRSKRRRTRREEREAVRQERLDAPAALDPQGHLDRTESRREVREALSRLSPRHAEILALRYSGLSYAEVADALDCGINHVGTLLRRAEAAFRKEVLK